MPNFVQFHHFGGEHEPSQGNDIGWNRGDHLRKFMEIQGSWVDKDARRDDDVKVWLWGEWEPELKLIQKFKHHGSGLPRYLWQPFWVRRRDYARCVNTDPMVFGGFYYSDCQQWINRGLRDLPKGSIIIFGSKFGGKWVIDTVFVVSDKEPYKINNYDASLSLRKNTRFCLPNGYEEVVLERTCGVLTDVKDRTLYIGATYDKPYDDMFSFFPCMPRPQDLSAGFCRPAIQLPEAYFDPNLQQGAGGAKAELPRGKVKELWLDVKQQVLSQGLCLGISASFPERREAR